MSLLYRKEITITVKSKDFSVPVWLNSRLVVNCQYQNDSTNYVDVTDIEKNRESEREGTSGPVHAYLDILNSELFLCRFDFRPAYIPLNSAYETTTF